MLLERGCSIASKCAYGYTALHQVAYTPFSSLCSFLLDCGGNLDSLSRNGSTPLLIAAREGHVEVVETMLRYGADPNDGGDKGLTPLVLAASEGHLEVVELLLSFGADANLSLFEGRTALHEAVESAHIQVCASLIRLGNACINTKDESGESAVTLASRLGFDDIVELLLNTQYQGTESRAADKHAVSVTTSRLRLPPSVAISN
jgi:ankyrin repeat protein